MSTTAQWLEKGERTLASRGVPEARPNAEWIMAHVLKAGRAELQLHLSRALSDKQANSFWHLLEQRARRVPLAYVLGSQPFLGLDIEVHEGALIPRPETEELVMEAARLLKARETEALTFVEIGTGTGCISVALAALFPKATIYATDISEAALSLARKNAAAHHVLPRVRFVREDLFKPRLSAGFADLVVSNPPYIPSKVVDTLEPEVLKEPRVALDGGPDGLDALRAIISQVPAFLKAGGWVALEIGRDQALAVAKLLHAQRFSGVMIRKDAQGADRFALARRS